MEEEASTTTRCLGGTQSGVFAGQTSVAQHTHVFRVTTGPDRGRSQTVVGPTVRIGSGEGNELQLSDQSVSRNHAEVTVRGMKFVLRDLDSTNGTRVDGVSMIEVFLEPGARIALGETELRFECDSQWVPVFESKGESFGALFGASPPMRALFGVLERVAPTSLTCLLTGETGTGKDLAAQAIHDRSPRSSGPFGVVDCAALHGNLVESELFGYRKGAFTGADRTRAGAFEQANGGTVFLDEIGELPLSLQPKLLRVLERREVKRLGEVDPRPCDVRVLAATHRDLEAMVEAGTFREDLYFRLSEIVLRLPPLRERLEDLPGLAKRLLAELSPPRRLSDDALAYLAVQSWPGNVRQLRNVLRRAGTLCTEEQIDRPTLSSLESLRGTKPPETSGTADIAVPVAEELTIKAARERWIQIMERRYMQNIDERYGRDFDRAAEHMGVHRKSVFRLLRAHGFMEEP